MSPTLGSELRRALAARIRFYNEMGIYDFYRRPSSERTGQIVLPIVDEQDIAVPTNHPESREEMSPRKATAITVPGVVEENIF
jgi:hypothetical protein